ncbi:DoxX family protein [Seminibacterium arietis]|uniref:DoxX family protein n=1 Tax=Seminibacterium arietis TaxID=1173502 RepID=A0ABW3I9K1_9PAST
MSNYSFQPNAKQIATQGVSFLILRLFLAYEFFESGLSKFQGENWFSDIQAIFPFPFNLLPADINWLLAMSAELLCPILLLLGLFTRLSSFTLIIVTVVAWYSVHAGSGYNVCNNGYKMALIYLVMLLPLLSQGAGSISVDFLLQKTHSSKYCLKFINFNFWRTK